MKKIIIILCCIVAISCVLGYTVRLEYEDFVSAFDNLDGSLNELYADIVSFKSISAAMKYYDPSIDQNIGWVGTPNPDTDNGLPPIAPYYIVYYSGDITDPDYKQIITDLNVPPNEIYFQDLWNLLEDFKHVKIGNSDTFDVAKGFNVVVTYLNTFILYFRAIINVTFEVLEIAFKLIESIFYLIGL